ncbi:acid protease [Westerdykella ornata]|uniref:Acid protease n=1 Tax=Westerdykella ornata TaxID=318751 RepID=A0A6A6JLM7_WESOR|nr:acid protease [Westerdykella ornata]KAF2276556.1 acid protease [Westerdykella ornata]
MASLVLTITLSLLLLAPPTFAFNCSKPPIYVDIHKRAVHDSSEFQYGSFIGVGTPAQNHSLWPSLTQNHTSFAASAYCRNSSLKGCEDGTGGFFVKSDSTSFQENDNFKSLDNSRFTGSSSFGQDTLRLYTHYFETDGASQTLVENSTIEIAEKGSIAPGIVGMGLSSTLLQSLVSKDIIAGRTYSLYIGQGFDRAGGAVNGSNTFGGFDAGRFTEPVHAYKMKESNTSPFTVRVKDITITSPDGRNVSLLDKSVFQNTDAGPFDAQLTTDQYPLSLPFSVTENFKRQLNARPDPENRFGDDSLQLPAPFAGSMTIVLDDGFSVTLPGEVLSNASNISPVQNRARNDSRPFYLSTAFLTQVYLMADFDSYTFFLAPAVQKNNIVMPTTFCPKSIPRPYVWPKQSAWVRNGLIGAVIGGVFGGIGIGIVGFCFWAAWVRRRAERREEDEERARKRAKMEQFEVEEGVGTTEFEGPPKRGARRGWRFWRR